MKRHLSTFLAFLLSACLVPIVGACDSKLGSRDFAVEGDSDARAADRAGPTDSAVPRCGNGVIETAEQCDGAALGGNTCQTQGFETGTLACSAACQLDLSGCRIASCGNGTRDANEQCEGTDLGGKTCVTQGFAGGTLACAANCALDTSKCYKCGDGVINGTEQCDGTQLGGWTCKLLGFAGGGTLGCNVNCMINTSGCTSTLPDKAVVIADKGVVADQGPAPDGSALNVTWIKPCWYLDTDGKKYQAMVMKYTNTVALPLNATLYFNTICDPGYLTDNLNDNGATQPMGWTWTTWFIHHPDEINTSAIWWIGTVKTGCIDYSTAPDC